MPPIPVEEPGKDEDNQHDLIATIAGLVITRQRTSAINMGYCKIHGPFVGETCNDCSDAEERAEADRAKMIERMEELRDLAPDADDIAYAINNPGDYECPYCRLRSLRRHARRCPKCRSDIDDDCWRQLLAAEERARKQREEVNKRLEAEERQQRILREAKDKAERESQEAIASKARERAEMLKVLNGVVFVYWGYLLPLLTCTGVPGGSEGERSTFYVPIGNWIPFVALTFFHLVEGDFASDFCTGMVKWILIGIVITGIRSVLTHIHRSSW